MLLVALAGTLFFVAGVLDGAYPGGEGTDYYYTYALGSVNVVLAVLIARGSERWLFLRIPTAAVLFVERIGSAYTLGLRSGASVAVHLLTALVELVILVTALHAWRLGRSFDAAKLDALFALSPAREREARRTPHERSDI